MDVHDNARTARRSRMLIVQRLGGCWSVAAVAEAQRVTPKTVRKWRDRYAGGDRGRLGRPLVMSPSQPQPAH
jgi:hypothetical protein